LPGSTGSRPPDGPYASVRWAGATEPTGTATAAAVPDIGRRALLSAGGGSIINSGSAAGTEGLAGFAGCAAAKEAIRALTRVAAREWGPMGIRVNAICPFANSEGMQGWSQLDPEGYRGSIERAPWQRVGDCEADTGRVVAFLASDNAAHLTAPTFMVDGGSGRFR